MTRTLRVVIKVPTSCADGIYVSRSHIILAEEYFLTTRQFY